MLVFEAWRAHCEYLTRIPRQGPAHPCFPVSSWFMGRRPEYTDPKVVAQGEGREGKT